MDRRHQTRAWIDLSGVHPTAPPPTMTLRRRRSSNVKRLLSRWTRISGATLKTVCPIVPISQLPTPWHWLDRRLVLGGIVVFDVYGFSSCQGLARRFGELRASGQWNFAHNINKHALPVWRHALISSNVTPDLHANRQPEKPQGQHAVIKAACDRATRVLLCLPCPGQKDAKHHDSL